MIVPSRRKLEAAFNPEVAAKRLSRPTEDPAGPFQPTNRKVTDEPELTVRTKLAPSPVPDKVVVPEFKVAKSTKAPELFS